MTPQVAASTADAGGAAAEAALYALLERMTEGRTRPRVLQCECRLAKLHNKKGTAVLKVLRLLSVEELVLQPTCTTAKEERHRLFAEWLVRTYGIEALASGSGVVDVAGGKGYCGPTPEQLLLCRFLLDFMWIIKRTSEHNVEKFGSDKVHVLVIRK
eukprot:gene8792-10419_t